MMELMLLVLLAAAFVLLVLFMALLQREWFHVRLRPLAGTETFRQLSRRAVEEGIGMHLALGTGRLYEANAAEMLAGVTVLDWLAEETTRTGQPPLVTTADPATALLAQDQLRAGHEGPIIDYARFIAPDPAAYAIRARSLAASTAPQLNMPIGHFGDEYLLVAAAAPAGAARLDRPPVAGAAAIEILPQVALTAENSFLAEELFAVGAYLGGWSSHLAGVIVQDVGRLAIVTAIVVGVVLRMIGG